MIKITKPTLLINERIARSNIKVMAEKARKNNISFEPHFKTHQSQMVGEWFRDEGAEAITVSSASMALYFSQAGWRKITIAFPVNILEINTLNSALKQSELTLLVQDVSVVEQLTKLNVKVELYIEIDGGYHRSGVEHNSLTEIRGLIDAIGESKHSFKGFYYHAGNSYGAKGEQEIKVVFDELIIVMAALKNEFSNHNPHIAIGDTPTCSVMNDFNGIDSIHPGNFVYYDYTQVQIGSCALEQVATYLICPVVAKNTERNELIIYGGGVHLSKESLQKGEGLTYGLVGRLDNDGLFIAYPDTYVKSISQEHGIISSISSVIYEVQVGDLVAIIPVHSCMTVDCMKETYTFDGVNITKMNK